MDNIITPLLVAAVIAAIAIFIVWPVLTWWNTPTERTFKLVVQDALRDVREIFAPVFCFFRRVWFFAGPRVTNLLAIAVVSLDAYVVQTPELKAAIMQTPWGLAVLVGLNLAASLSPRGAPDRVPPPPAGAIAA